MKTFSFLLFILIPKLVLSDDDESENVINSRASTQSINGVYILMYFIFAVLLGYFALTLFLGICCCKPNYSSPTCCDFSFHIFASAILLVVSILYFISISKFKNLTKSSYYYYNYQNIFQKNSFDFNETLENISNMNDYSSKTSILIKQMAFEYNTTFSDQNGQYRKAFNNIYNNFDTPNCFKYDLKGMDESRKNIISKIFNFVDKHIKISLSVKNMYENFFNGAHDLIKTQNHKQIKSISENIMNYTFCYIIVVCLIFLVLIVGIIYFFSNKCSKCCFCTFPIYPLVILFASFLSNLYLNSQNYYDIYHYCQYTKRSTMSNQIEGILQDINKVINNFELGYEIIQEKEEVSVLNNNLSSNIIHENYSIIYSHYSFNNEYKNDLNEMAKVIKSKENDLQKMKSLFNEITQIDNNIISLINDIKHNISLLVKNQKQSINKITQSNEIHSDYESTCNSLFNAYNINLVATFFMFIGLFLLAISVCLRRKTLEYSFKFDFDEKSNSSGIEETRENISSKKENKDPFTVENCNGIEGYIIGYMKLGIHEPVKDLINEVGDLGKGIYIFLDKDELLSIYKDIYPTKTFLVVYLVPVIVNAKRVLNIGNKTHLFSLPDAFQKYDFDSVKFIAKNGTHRLLICNPDSIGFGKETQIEK